MIYTRPFALLALLVLLLAACSQTLDPTSNLAQPSNALITDADIDHATLEVARREIAVSGSDVGAIPDGAHTELPNFDAQLSSQAVQPGVGGYITYVRIVRGTSNIWQLWVSNQSTDQSTLVYEGNRSINSTTINLAGDTLFFTAQVTAGSTNFEVYKLTLSNNAITRLTNTTTAEGDASVSANGQTVAWGGINSSTRKRAVFLRSYSGTSFSQKILGVSGGNQYEPTVSGDGAYVALIRQTTKIQVMRFRKSNSSYLVVATPSTSVYVRAPSVSNSGAKVAWGEENKSTGSTAVKVKTISGGSVLTAGSSTGPIRHPHLSSDGAYLTYVLPYNGSDNVSTKNLSTGQVARLTSDASSSITNAQAFWQKGAATSSPITIQGTVTSTSGYPVRVKLFQAATGALVREVAANSSGFYSFTSLAPMRYYVTAYEDVSYDGVQGNDEPAGAFGRPAIPTQIDAVSDTYTANLTLTYSPSEIEVNNDLSTDNLLLQTTAINGYLDYGDYDYFKLYVPAAGTYSLRTTGSCSYSDEYTNYSPDTYLEIYSLTGTTLASNDDGGDGYCSLITYSFTQAGTYFVNVRGLSSGSVGNYNLAFQR